MGRCVLWATSAALLGFFLGFLALGASGVARAVDFSCPIVPDRNCNTHVYISGDFERGDAARFREELKRRGPIARYVILWSSTGGDSFEAMEFGRLIRKLKMETAVSHDLGGRPPFLTGTSDGQLINVSERDSLCAGPCFLVWVAGIRRDGNHTLAIGRPVFAADHFAGLDEAGRTAKEIELRGDIQRYLSDMDVGPTVWQIMNAIGGEGAIALRSEYLMAEVPVGKPRTALADTSECGVADTPLRKISIPENMRSDPVFDFYVEAFNESFRAEDCRIKFIDEAALAA